MPSVKVDTICSYFANHEDYFMIGEVSISFKLSISFKKKLLKQW